MNPRTSTESASSPGVQTLETVDRFIRERVEPHAQAIDEQNVYPQDLHDEAAALGLFALAVPEEYGGLGVSFQIRLQVIERLARSSGTFAVIVCTIPDGLDPTRTHGAETLKQKYLPGVAKDELIPAIALSEPSGGSDVAAMRTTAERDGDVYVINGTKTW